MTRRIPGRSKASKESLIIIQLRLAQKQLTTVYAATVLENKFDITSSDLKLYMNPLVGYVNALELISRYLVAGSDVNIESLSTNLGMKRFMYRMMAVPELDRYSEIEYNISQAIKLLTSCINKIQLTRAEHKDLIEKTLKFIRSKLRRI